MIYLATFSAGALLSYDGSRTILRLIGKDMEGSGCSLIEALYRHLLGGTVKLQKRPSIFLSQFEPSTP
jgi:hypothetical protein